MDKNKTSPLPVLLELLIAGALVAIGLKYISGFEMFFDIGFSDDSGYLAKGFAFKETGILQPDYGPLYCLWFYVLSLVQPDRITLYYLSNILITLMYPSLLYLLLRRMHIQRALAVAAAFFHLISFINVQSWPKTSHFALIAMLVFLTCICRIKSVLTQISLSALAALLCAYIRPEFFITFLLLMLFFLYRLLRRTDKRLAGAELTSFSITLLVTVVLLISWGNPVSRDRSLIAFGQHYSLNKVSWSDIRLSPLTNWQEITASDFGNAQSIPGAAQNNPAMFLKHVGCNTVGSIRHGIFLLGAHQNFILPDSFEGKRIERYMLMGMCLFLAVLYRKRWLLHTCETWNRNKNLFIIFGCFALPPLVSCVIIYPRSHYFVVPVALLTATLLLFVSPRPASKLSLKTLGVSALALLVLYIVTPGVSGPVTSNRENVGIIRFLQSLNIEKQVFLLESGGIYSVFAGSNYRTVPFFIKNEPFDTFIDTHSINMMIIADGLDTSDSRYMHDDAYKRFLKNPDHYGFTKIPKKLSNKTLYLKKELVPSSLH